MASRKGRILPLPPDVRAQIKSSVVITSLSDVVIELIKNSLDAQARDICVHVDYLHGGCSVEDDGNGISASDLAEDGHLGTMYCTSKHNPLAYVYGSHGCFISSLSALSLLSITSRHHAEAGECTATFRQSHVLARFRTSQEHHRILNRTSGTKVTVRDLFGELPVRVKHRAIQYELQQNLDKEFEDLKRRLVGLLLAWSKPVKIIISDTEKKRSLLRLKDPTLSHGKWDGENGTTKLPFRLDWILALLAQAGYICNSSFTSWFTASARTSMTHIRAAISLEPVPTKQVQFFSFGIRPIDPVYGSQVLSDEVNRIFALSSFGVTEEESEVSEAEKLKRQKDKRYKNDEYLTRQLRGAAKGADRWPMFYIRIDSSSGNQMPDEFQTQDLGGEALRVLQKVLQLVKTLIHQFLEEHHFRPRTARQKLWKGKETGAFDQQNSFGDIAMPSLSNQLSSKSADSSPRFARTGPTHSSPVLKRHVNSLGFDMWSRVKTGNRDGIKHILSGLPRSRTLPSHFRPATAPAASGPSRNADLDTGMIAPANIQMRHRLDDDVQLLLESLEDEDVFSASDEGEVDDENLPSTISPKENPIGKEDDIAYDNFPTDETIIWRDSTNGRVLRINSRTGLVVPDLQASDGGNKTGEVERSAGLAGKPESRSTTTLFRSMRPIRNTLESGIKVAPGSWVGNLLNGSENSIFRQLEEAIPSIAPEDAITDGKIGSCRHGKACDEGLKGVAASFNVMARASRARLSKRGLADAQVLAQVDRKFILVKITADHASAHITAPNGEPTLPGETLLVLIDQHAADERCQVESLYEELCEVETVQLPNPICFEVPAPEARLFRTQQVWLAGWGFRYDTKTGPAHSTPQFATSNPKERLSSRKREESHGIMVTALPKLISERCRLEPKILIDLLRSEIWDPATNTSAKSRTRVSTAQCDLGQPDAHTSSGDKKWWLCKMSTCPKGLIEMLNSRACRSAIMFNDVLSTEECERLVKRLAKCSFPFQCAHGRPSMVVLGALGSLDSGNGWPLDSGFDQEDVEGGGDFVKAFKNWQVNI